MDLVRRVGLSPNVRKKQIQLKGRIFGVPLLELTERCDNEHQVPNIVYQCTSYIRKHGLHEEGLFRVSGNRRIIDQVHAEYEQFGYADLSNVHDVSVVTSIFKMFFRELPDPLISDEVSQAVLKVAENRSLSTPQLVESLRRCCKTLPPVNFAVLRYLCTFLNEVGKNVADTKMTDSSLAIVFGPNLFRIKNDLEALQRQPTITKAMGCLITHHHQIFYSTPEEDTRPGMLPSNMLPSNLYSEQAGVIQVESANLNSTHSAMPCFILPQQDATKLGSNKENVTNNKVAGNKARDWDDTWLAGLANDSPSPETEDILARSHDSLSSMSPLTGSGNLSIHFSLQQTIKECIWDMLIPAPASSDHSFNYQTSHKVGQDGGPRRKGPRPEYHSNRNSCVAIDNLRTVNHPAVSLKGSEFDAHSPSPSPPLNRRSSDGMFNLGTCQPLTSLTKGRASPQKRRQVSKPRAADSKEHVPKLNLKKLPKVESVSSLTCHSDVSSVPSPRTPRSHNSIASLTSKIALLKQQVVAFETAFEREHARTPQGNERRPISSTIKEINELKRLLIDAKAVESSARKTSLSNQYSMIYAKMEEKRKLASRPHDLKLMSHSQLTDEKLCIQKLLLHFEETYGRPKTKDQKDTMRPIYDRYRKVKLALNKAKAGGDKHSDGGDKTPTGANNMGDTCHLGDTWNVTLGTSSVVSGMELINLSPDQLNDKLGELQESKKSLRKTLRDYEKAFLGKHGRKVLKEDRGPRAAEYNEYKKVKAKIRLIETLLKKTDGSQTI